MNDNIIDLLDLTDNDSEITDITIEGSLKKVTLMKKPRVKYCPVCSTRLHSKGRFTRHPHHQILQDGYTLEITANENVFLPEYRKGLTDDIVEVNIRGKRLCAVIPEFHMRTDAPPFARPILYGTELSARELMSMEPWARHTRKIPSMRTTRTTDSMTHQTIITGWTAATMTTASGTPPRTAPTRTR